MIDRTIKERGAVYIELICILPVLMMFLVGILDFGLYFSKASWIAHSVYQTVVIGGDRTAIERETAMREHFEKMWSLQKDSKVSMDLKEDLTPASGSDDVNLTITVDIGNFFNSFLPLDIRVNLNLAGPIMLLDLGALPGGGGFQNPGSLYDCYGDLQYCSDNEEGCATTPSNSCWW